MESCEEYITRYFRPTWNKIRGFRNMSLSFQLQNNCIKCNNNNLRSLQKYCVHKIKGFYTEWFRVCPNITSKFLTIAVIKSFVKEINDSNKIRTYVYKILLY
jgi:hypothetical protein